MSFGRTKRAAPGWRGLARRLGTAVATLALVCAVAPKAHAERDPSTAEAHARAARAELSMEFCRAPKKPLSPEALLLCDDAGAVPECEGFAAACREALKKPEKEPSSDATKAILEALAAAAHVLVYLLVAAAVVALLVPIVRAIRRRKRDAAVADPATTNQAVPAAPEGPKAVERVDDAEDALRRADDLARAGELTRATNLYLAASLAALDRRGAIHITKSRTNGEYVRACAEPESRPKLRGITNEVDRVHFGGEPPSEERVGKVAGLARALVRAVPLAALALGLIGCTPPGRPRMNDPAGNELFVETMKRQGMPVTPFGSSLASLRPLTDGEAAPILVLDLEQAMLEPDAEDAVVAWVASGGVLVLFGTSNKKLSKTFEFSSQAGSSSEVDGRLTPLALEAQDEDDDGDETEQMFLARLERARSAGTRHFRGHVPAAGVVTMAQSFALVTLGAPGHDEGAYARERRYEKGVVVVVHDGALLRNVGVARPGNAAVVAALFTELSASPAFTGGPEERRTAEVRTIKLARREDGLSPPDNPFSALAQAGLTRGMWHAFLASLVLFLAYGARHARPKPEAAPSRRAFAEHVLATGAFYARSPHPPHALASFARFAEDRIRHALPRGTSDVPAFLAHRSGRSLEDCRALWERAASASPDDSPKGDELRVLGDLRGVLVAALRRDASGAAAGQRTLT